MQAILFQSVNLKLWAITIAASAGFSIGLPPLAEVVRLFLAFAGINLFVCLFLTTAGQLLSGLLTSDSIWRGFMLVMATVMASTVLVIFL